MSDDWPNMPMPTADDLRGRPWLTGAHLDVCLLLLEHGINVDMIPGSIDAFHSTGYLQVTGRVIGNEVETERQPWPAGLWREVRRLASGGA